MQSVIDNHKLSGEAADTSKRPYLAAYRGAVTHLLLSARPSLLIGYFFADPVNGLAATLLCKFQIPPYQS